MVNIGNDWDQLLKEEFSKEYYLRLREFLKTEYSCRTIYPSMYDIFNAFKETPYQNVRVVIIGQDPYHNPGQAHGMCFSVQPGVQMPPSLLNIFKELERDLGVKLPENGCLIPWAKQGVLLLNAVLTVRSGSAGSHAGKGWEILTDRAIQLLNERKEPIVFLLWGNYARAKKALITNQQHLVLEAAHPSPLSAYNGFFGCRHFSKTNQFLENCGYQPINWQI